MRIYYRGRYVKNVPAKYAKIPDLPDHFEDLHSTRLSVREYWILKMALFHYNMQPFFTQLAMAKPETYRLIEKSSPEKAFFVKSKIDKQTWYSLLFRNGQSIRIPRKIFRRCPKRFRDMATYPGTTIAPPPVEQLKLF